MKTLKIVVIVFLWLALPLTTYASCENKSDEECKKDDENRQQAISTTVGLGVALTTGIAVSVTMTTNSNNQKATYFEKNNKAIRQALAMGHGDAIEDILKFYNIKDDQRERAIQALKDNRPELLEKIALEKLTPQRAAEADQYFRTVLTKR